MGGSYIWLNIWLNIKLLQCWIITEPRCFYIILTCCVLYFAGEASIVICQTKSTEMKKQPSKIYRSMWNYFDSEGYITLRKRPLAAAVNLVILLSDPLYTTAELFRFVYFIKHHIYIIYIIYIIHYIHYTITRESISHKT